MRNSFNIVLVEPEIPQNTGNIVRLCACTGSNLFLVGKIGFSLSDKHLKRAGLDYWSDVEICKYESIKALKAEFKVANFYYFTTKTNKLYTKARFNPGDFFVFGPESRGLEDKLLESEKENLLTIPMVDGARSLNLSNSVAIVTYEALRQCQQ